MLPAAPLRAETPGPGCRGWVGAERRGAGASGAALTPVPAPGGCRGQAPRDQRAREGERWSAAWISGAILPAASESLLLWVQACPPSVAGRGEGRAGPLGVGHLPLGPLPARGRAAWTLGRTRGLRPRPAPDRFREGGSRAGRGGGGGGDLGRRTFAVSLLHFHHVAAVPQRGGGGAGPAARSVSAESPGPGTAAAHFPAARPSVRASARPPIRASPAGLGAGVSGASRVPGKELGGV